MLKDETVIISHLLGYFLVKWRYNEAKIVNLQITNTNIE